jgi:hypothetical protein
LEKVQSYLDGKIPEKTVTRAEEAATPVVGSAVDSSGLTDEELSELGDLGDLFPT